MDTATVDRSQFLAELADLGAVQFGTFTLASGSQSPIYVDLRLLVSAPRILKQAAQLYAQQLDQIEYDRIAGVPYAALPIGTAVSLIANCPLVYPRKEVKEYGTGKQIEGIWHAGDRIAIIEDLITSGGSTIRSADRLRSAGIVVSDVIVLIDREQGGRDNLTQAGLTLHSVFTLSEILDALVQSGHVDDMGRTAVHRFIQENQVGTT